MNIHTIRDLRKKLGLTQIEFWSRVGVTQTGGSRYENENRTVSKPVRILLQLAYGTQKQAESVMTTLRSKK